MNEMTENSDFTWVLSVLGKNLGINPGILKPKSMSARQIGDRYGFLSKIFQLKFDWGQSLDYGKLPDSLVVKVCTTDKAFKTLGTGVEDTTFGSPEWSSEIHAAESTLYSFLAKKPNCTLPVPHYLGSVVSTDPLASQIPQCLLLEDLTDSTYMPYVTDGLSIDMLNSVVDALTDFHAFSYTDSSWIEENFGANSEKTIRDLKPIIIELAEQACQNYPGMFKDNHLETVKRIVGNEALWAEEYSWPSDRKPNPKHVLSHADLWAHNLLFAKRDGQKTCQLKAILDWQFTSVGSPTQDLARVLVASVTPEIRRSVTNSLLDRYYNRLTATCPQMKSEGQTETRPKVHFSRNDLDKMFCQSHAIACALGVVDLSSQVDFAKTRDDSPQGVNEMVRRCRENLEDISKYDLIDII